MLFELIEPREAQQQSQQQQEKPPEPPQQQQENVWQLGPLKAEVVEFNVDEGYVRVRVEGPQPFMKEVIEVPSYGRQSLILFREDGGTYIAYVNPRVEKVLPTGEVEYSLAGYIPPHLVERWREAKSRGEVIDVSGYVKIEGVPETLVKPGEVVAIDSKYYRRVEGEWFKIEQPYSPGVVPGGLKLKLETIDEKTLQATVYEESGPKTFTVDLTGQQQPQQAPPRIVEPQFITMLPTKRTAYPWETASGPPAHEFFLGLIPGYGTYKAIESFSKHGVREDWWMHAVNIGLDVVAFIPVAWAIRGAVKASASTAEVARVFAKGLAGLPIEDDLARLSTQLSKFKVSEYAAVEQLARKGLAISDEAKTTIMVKETFTAKKTWEMPLEDYLRFNELKLAFKEQAQIGETTISRTVVPGFQVVRAVDDQMEAVKLTALRKGLFTRRIEELTIARESLPEPPRAVIDAPPPPPSQPGTFKPPPAKPATIEATGERQALQLIRGSQAADLTVAAGTTQKQSLRQLGFTQQPTVRAIEYSYSREAMTAALAFTIPRMPVPAAPQAQLAPKPSLFPVDFNLEEPGLLVLPRFKPSASPFELHAKSLLEVEAQLKPAFPPRLSLEPIVKPSVQAKALERAGEMIVSKPSLNVSPTVKPPQIVAPKLTATTISIPTWRWGGDHRKPIPPFFKPPSGSGYATSIFSFKGFRWRTVKDPVSVERFLRFNLKGLPGLSNLALITKGKRRRRGG